MIGFDLDLTLVDATPAVTAILLSVSEALGLSLDVPAIVAGLGPPLEDLLSEQLSRDAACVVASAYRDLYVLHGPRHAVVLPGAYEALAACDGAVVVTGQNERSARAQIRHSGFDVDHVVGSVWGPAKADVLRAHRVFAYVGDHPDDMAAARSAGVLAVGVTSGRHTAAELAAAHVVLPSLSAFPSWLKEAVSP